MSNEEFVMKVLRLAIQYDCADDLFWRIGNDSPFFEGEKGERADEPLSVMVNCNDLFAWACADCEEITPDNIGEWERALKDTAELGGERFYGSQLFAARVRRQRPQKPCYKSWSPVLAGMFDACGPA